MSKAKCFLEEGHRRIPGVSGGFGVRTNANVAAPTTRVAKGYCCWDLLLPGVGRCGMDDELNVAALVRRQILDELAARGSTVRAIVVVLTTNLQLQRRARPRGVHRRCERRPANEERAHEAMPGVCSIARPDSQRAL